MIYCDHKSFPEQLTLFTLTILLGRVFGSCWKGFDFERQIFTPVDEFRLHKVFSLDFIQITYFVSISFQITYTLIMFYKQCCSRETG